MLFEQVIRLAASRTFCTAGTNKPTSTAMIAITTSNSISVKPKTRKRFLIKTMEHLAEEEEKSLRQCLKEITSR